MLAAQLHPRTLASLSTSPAASIQGKGVRNECRSEYLSAVLRLRLVPPGTSGTSANLRCRFNSHRVHVLQGVLGFVRRTIITPTSPKSLSPPAVHYLLDWQAESLFEESRRPARVSAACAQRHSEPEARAHRPALLSPLGQRTAARPGAAT